MAGKVYMDFQELITPLRQVLFEYESGDRAPQRAMEVITALFNRVDKSSNSLPATIEQIRVAVDAWNDGDRADIDVLATTSALVRQL